MHHEPSFPDKTERRSWQRTALREGCLIFESGGALGEVLDIGKGGIGLLSIYTVPGDDRVPGKGLLCCPGTLLENLSYKVVSSEILPREFEFSTLVKTRYGLQFINLTDSQKFKLDRIIRTCRQS